MHIHGPVKYCSLLASKRQNLQAGTHGPGALTKEGYIVWIPSKNRNIVFDPY